jgi:hypothetical protein
VATAITEYFNEDVGRSINYSRTVGKTRYAIDEAVELDYAGDFIKIANLVFGYGEEIKRTDAGSGLTVSDVAGLTDLTGVGHLAVDEADGTREVE